jgi:PAS domain S-box-containing protein
MNRSEPASAHATAVDEIAALVETLHRTEQRLETLTSGQVDTVTSAEGRTFLLRRAQDQLRLDEAVKQAAILNALPDHVALLDPRGVIVSVNDSWRRFGDANGLTLPDHGMGSSYLETCERSATLGSAVAGRVAAGIRAVLAGTEPRFSIEYPCHSPGEQRWFVLTVTPLVAGQPRGAIVMHANVSERARAEASSHQTTALLQAVVDGTPDLVFVKGTDHRYLLCNAALARFHGRPTRDVLGRDDRDLYGAEEARDALMQDREAMRLGRAVDSESVITGVAGPRRMHHWKAPYRDDRGAMIGVIGVSRDVTEERRLTADLEAEQARLVAVQDLARIGSWSFVVATKAYDWTLQTHLLFGTDPRQFVPTIEACAP